MSSPFAAVLLAGGRSTRMKQDKALLHWHEQALWQVQLHKLLSLGAERVLLSCRSEQALLVNDGVEIIHDPAGVDDGPLGAITRCLECVQMPLLVLAVDMPWMTAAFLREQLSEHENPDQGWFFCGSYGAEALAGMYVPAMLPHMRQALSEKNLKLQHVIKACVHNGSALTHEMSDEQVAFFHNVNTPADLNGLSALP
jgi:molybdopterin-guanine dinucleotide biosynthesis protein A